MKIDKAIEAMKQGKKIRRVNWSDKEDCLKLFIDNIIRFGSAYSWIPTTADLLADDWEVVD